MKKIYEVIIIGGGPSGLILSNYLHENNIDFLLIDQGKNISKRKCIKNCNKCNEKFCNILSGIGGAGFFSDGKLNFSYDIGGNTKKVFSKKEYNLAIKYLIKKFNFTINKKSKILIKNFNNTHKNICKFISIDQSHIGSDNLIDFINKLSLPFKHKIITEEEIKKINYKNNLFNISINNKNYISKILVIATGQAGSSFAVKMANKNHVQTYNGVADIGIRLEVSSFLYDPLIKLQYDPKLYFKTNPIIRTFCTNPNGYIIKENKGDYVTVNGYSNMNTKSKKTNFAMMCSLYNLNNSKKFTENICKKISLHTKNELIKETINEFRKKSELQKFYPPKVINSLKESLNILEKVLNKKLIGTIYAPEVKLYNNNIDVKKNTFESSFDNLYFIGDCVGWIHGITNACISGLLAGKNILNKISKNRNIKKISWKTYEDMIIKLKKNILNKKKPDSIFGISRGGLIPAVNFAHLFGLNEIGIIALKKNKNDKYFEINKKNFVNFNSILPPTCIGKNIFLIDDIVGYGDTINTAYNILKKNYPKATITKIALVINKERLNENNVSIKKVIDYYSIVSDKNTWIVFPWE